MDDLAMAIAAAVIEVPVMEALEKRFQRDHTGGCVMRRLRSNAEGVFRIGGIDGLQIWVDAREQQGIGSDEEREELRRIKGCIAHNTSRSRNKWIREFDAQAKAERQEAELKSLRTQELLAARARDQRAEIDPRAAIKARLENVLELTPPPIPAPVPTPDPTSYSRKVKGECGERIGYKIDCIVRDIQGPEIENEAEWPDDEPLLLDELISEIRHQSSCESTCCAPFETVVDPPYVTVTITLGGGDEDMGAPSDATGAVALLMPRSRLHQFGMHLVDALNASIQAVSSWSNWMRSHGCGLQQCSGPLVVYEKSWKRCQSNRSSMRRFAFSFRTRWF